MRKQVRRQLQHSSLLAFDIEQNIGWSRQTVLRRIADYSEGKQWYAAGGAGTRDEFCLHIRRDCSRCERKLVSLFRRIDQRRHRQKIRDLNVQT